MFRWILCRWTRGTFLFSFLLIAGFALAQSDFSADIVNTGKEGTPLQAKIYLTKDKMRIEPEVNTQHGPGGVMIVNLATQISTVLMSQQHMYLEIPAQAANQKTSYNFFRTGDIDSACTDWLALSSNKGGTCHKAGSETVNGRSTVKIEGTNSKGEPATVWIDPKLRFPVKWEGKNSSGELRNIQEGSQPASLFEIPAGFTKFDMGNMMQRPQ
jgi:hypothetical protein